MKDLPPELLYVLAIAAVMLVQIAMKRFAPPKEQDAATSGPLEEAPAEALEVSAAASTPAVGIDPLDRAGAASAAALRRGRRFSRRSLMGTRREVQNAVVIALILGPCRAFEPHDIG